MEDMRQRGYPVYSEDELGMIQQVVSASDCTGLEPRPPMQEYEDESYSELYNKPQQTMRVNNGFQEEHPEKRDF
jgi:hypothetical protein